MSHGLKSLAQELPQYGRYNDDMVAHISSDEARLLKSLGGSGTINPHTGLPEFGWNPVKEIKNFVAPVTQPLAPILKPLEQAATQVFQPIEKAVVQPVGQSLAQLDKSVGKAIPGGWGTVGMMAGSAMGLPTYAMVGLGALNGSGVLHPGRGFNLQGALMGGAMAYGASQLGAYARGAAEGVAEGATQGAVDVVEKAAENSYDLMPSGYQAGPDGSMIELPPELPPANVPAPQAPVPSAPVVPEPAPFDPSYDPNAGIRQPIMDSLSRGEFGDAAQTLANDVTKGVSNFGSSVADTANSAFKSAGSAFDTATSPQTYSDLATKAQTYGTERLADASRTMSGVGNLLSGGSSSLPVPLGAIGVGAYGAMGLGAIEEQRKYLEEAKAANQISQQEYDKMKAEIDRSVQDAKDAVAAHPFNANPDISGSLSGSGTDRPESMATVYDPIQDSSTRLYAAGGTVNAPNMVNPPDDQTGMPSQSPLSKDFGMSGFMENSLEALTKLLVGSNSNSNNASPQYDQRPQDFDRPAPVGYPQPSYPAACSFPSGGAAQGAAGLGSISSAGNAFPLQGQYGIVKMAQGGLAPRFLSGGGDGMSDSIKASINGNQEARLADGEFVIPADVVSHIGNGSSKAGAKQLYSMMDRVRTARTGRKSQGKEINARKYMAA